MFFAFTVVYNFFPKDPKHLALNLQHDYEFLD